MGQGEGTGAANAPRRPGHQSDLIADLELRILVHARSWLVR
jgi:hypothetical protein